MADPETLEGSPYVALGALPAARLLGTRLKSLRQHAGLTQLELAERAGLSRAYLAALERGLSSATKAPPRPSRAILAALAGALGLPAQELLGLPLPFEAAGPETSPLPGLVELPAADAALTVAEPGEPELGWLAGDVVLVRTCDAEPWPEGICLLEGEGKRQWGRVARIQKRLFLASPDGSYRPMPVGMRIAAEAIALFRSLNP